MTEILPDLIDSTCIDSRILFNIPPKYGHFIYDDKGRYLKTDSSKATFEEKRALLAWKRRNWQIEKDTSKIIIGFDSKIKFRNDDFTEDFEKHFKGSKLHKLKKEDCLDYKIDIEKIKLKSKFKLMDLSKFPERDKIWETKYNFNFSGVVFFNKIQFDTSKKYGILDGGFLCGVKCGQGYRIYIKKVNSKWKIDKVDRTWES